MAATTKAGVKGTRDNTDAKSGAVEERRLLAWRKRNAREQSMARDRIGRGDDPLEVLWCLLGYPKLTHISYAYDLLADLPPKEFHKTWQRVHPSEEWSTAWDDYDGNPELKNELVCDILRNLWATEVEDALENID